MARKAPILPTLLPLVALVAMAGCGGGTEAGTPEAGRSVLGTVLSADDATPIPGATVSAGSLQGRALAATTDAEGRFTLTGLSPGELRLGVQLPANSPYHSMDVDLTVPEDEDADVTITLVPNDVRVDELIVTPELARLIVGETQQFTASLTTGDSAVLEPTWTVRGHVGVIDRHGLFLARRPGTGLVLARVGDLVAGAVVRVRRPEGPDPGELDVLLEAEPLSGPVPLRVTFTGHGPPGVAITDSALSFGDGQLLTGPVPPSHETHEYGRPNRYVATLVLTAADGRVGAARVEIHALPSENQPPVLTAHAEPQSGEPPLEVTFHGEAMDPDGEIVGVVWKFGDGSEPVGQADVVHTYSEPGTYTAVFGARDDDGAVAHQSIVIQVGEGSLGGLDVTVE